MHPNAGTQPAAAPRAAASPTNQTPTGHLVGNDLDQCYRIDHFDHMPPFLMSVVSESDLWMFISSTGGLTAGRRRPDFCLFPYETDDRLHLSASHTGPLTFIRINGETRELWQPFFGPGTPLTHRSLSKSALGCGVEFEERRTDLGLTFRYRWAPAAGFGFVRTASIELEPDAAPVTFEILDGVQGIMHAGVELETQRRASTLADAYKRSELDASTGLGIYALEARISDRPEPAESLRANVVWSAGFDASAVLLGSNQVEAFCAGHEVKGESLRTGQRGTYLLVGTISLTPGQTRSWDIVADVNLAQEDVVEIRSRIGSDPGIRTSLAESIHNGADQLARIIADSDGLQATADPIACAHHQANVLFNVMRGGIFAAGYAVNSVDFNHFVQDRNAPTARRREVFLRSLPDTLEHSELLRLASDTEDPDLIRLCHEYLPLTFSRRHGDPSRPWNTFDIRVAGPRGQKRLNYEGNWRDIFQNWETLCESYPWFIESVIAKFVNASTMDGFNPYRIGRDGIDWEESDPTDPWSNIGYWGDHQIVYLLRLLESSRRHRPSELRAMLYRPIFSYADVPYRIRDYDALLHDSKNTIEFDLKHANHITERVSRIGADGRLVHNREGSIHHVSLVEKLLIPALSKLSNTVPDAGVWLNTQRPEWNDANNALAGRGLSMVTLCHLRRYLSFCIDLLKGQDDLPVTLSAEVAVWFDEILTILTESLEMLEPSEVSAADKKTILDRLGRSFSSYRAQVYAHGLSTYETRPIRAIADLCRIARHHVDHAINANRRPDGLFHSYNLMHTSKADNTIELGRLPEMLEGQVAALGSGTLTGTDVLDVVDQLFTGPLYRLDQRSFMLYPEREPVSYLDRNIVPTDRVQAIGLLEALVSSGDTTVIVHDADGRYRFSSDFRSAHDLRRALIGLEGSPKWTEAVRADRLEVHGLFEDVFNHRAFLGRSGTMYKYEGIGSVYWHMVSKLLLTLQERFFECWDLGERPETLMRLARAYHEVRAGLGFNKSPLEHGAIPIDPYSHTPRGLGAQQPGMTGQVKEGVLIRLGELGIRVSEGRLRFQPRLLHACEFLAHPTVWHLHTQTNGQHAIELEPGSLAFTLCATPIIYRLTEHQGAIESLMAGGRRRRIDGDTLDEIPSAELFGRTGRVSAIEVSIPRSVLLDGWCTA